MALTKSEKELVDILCGKLELNEKTKYAVSNSVNCISFHADEIANWIVKNMEASEACRLKVYEICGSWMEVLRQQYRHHRYDERNRYSAMVGNILSDVIPDITEPGSPVRKYLTEPMSKEHRTLQQTFSGLLFRVIRSMVKGKDTKLLAWRCPRFRTEEDAQRYPYCPAV